MKLRGSWLAPLRAGEPEPAAGEPQPPRKLSRRAQVLWRYTVPLLEAMGTLCRSDGEALAAYCEAVELYEKAKDPQQKLAWRNKADQLGQQFGLTPSSRTRIKVEKPKDQSSKARFFSTSAG